MDCDRIMVLGAGKLKEMDEPYTLLKSKGSLLSEMVSQVSKEEAEKLEQIALEARNKKKAQTEEWHSNNGLIVFSDYSTYIVQWILL